MSYNIDRWSERECELTGPFDAFDALSEADLDPGEELSDGYILKEDEFGFNFDPEVATMAYVPHNDGTITIRHIQIYGVGSGHFYEDYFVKALEQTQGHYKALLVWEGGDTVAWMTVRDGVVAEEEV